MFERGIFSCPIRFMGEDTDSQFFSIDVGGGGIRLYTSKELAPDKVYELDLLLASIRRPVRVRTKLAWQRRLQLRDEIYEVGLVFQDISLEDRKMLEEHASAWTPMTSEKRKFLRIPKILQGSLADEKEGGNFSGYVLDIGEEGARFVTSRDLGDTKRVILKLELETGTPLSLTASVAWKKSTDAFSELIPGAKYVYGLKFLIESYETQASIKNYANFQRQSGEAGVIEALLAVGSKEHHEGGASA